MGDERVPHVSELPIACTLVATDGEARLARLRALSAARLDARRTRNQLVGVYRSGSGIQQELEALVTAEREGCSAVASTW